MNKEDKMFHIHLFKKTTWEELGSMPYSEYIKPSLEWKQPKVCRCGLIRG